MSKLNVTELAAAADAAYWKPATVPKEFAALCASVRAKGFRALAGNGLVRPATRDRIRAIAAERGYQLNVAARNLRQKKSRTIAVVIEMLPTNERPMSDPYPLALLGGIIQERGAGGT